MYQYVYGFKKQIISVRCYTKVRSGSLSDFYNSSRIILNCFAVSRVFSDGKMILYEDNKKAEFLEATDVEQISKDLKRRGFKFLRTLHKIIAKYPTIKKPRNDEKGIWYLEN